MRTIVGFVAAAAIALGIAVYWRPSKHIDRVAPPSDRLELERLQAALADEVAARTLENEELKAQLRTFSNALAAQGTAAAVPALAAAAHDAVSEPTKPSPPEPQEPVDAHEHFEEVFAGQPIDASWANAAQGRIEQKLHASLPGAKLQSIECHATLCRLETAHRDQAAYGQFVSDAFKEPSKRIWAGDAFTEEPTESAQGELVVVSYLAREGEPLPELR